MNVVCFKSEPVNQNDPEDLISLQIQTMKINPFGPQ